MFCITIQAAVSVRSPRQKIFMQVTSASELAKIALYLLVEDLGTEDTRLFCSGEDSRSTE